MDLAGGDRKSLRKAVHRVERHGYVPELHAVGELDAATIAQLHEVSGRWLDGAPDRGFSMAHDDLVDELLPDALVVLARDSDQRVRGFLHFAPVFGRPVVSLGFMRRDRDTPNGLTDFLVVHAARLLAERGITEFSLNFAAFGRWLRAPSNVLERGLGRLLRVGDRWFQIERLYRFNAKFGPRWQPRYLLFDRPLALPAGGAGRPLGRGAAAQAPAAPSPPERGLRAGRCGRRALSRPAHQQPPPRQGRRPRRVTARRRPAARPTRARRDGAHGARGSRRRPRG